MQIEVTATSVQMVQALRMKRLILRLADDNTEFSISAVVDNDATTNEISENSSVGDLVGVTAFASDADAGDSVTYSLSSNPNNAFAIDPNTGEVTVADPKWVGL